MKDQIQQTTEYNRFELLGFNRDVGRLKHLETSMRNYGFLGAYPLHVVVNGNGKYKIKAGHHRFTVARKLGIPVKFVICDDGGVTIHELEKATNKWTAADYLNSYMRQGNPHYAEVDRYRRRTGVPMISAVSMLGGETAGSSNKMEPFKSGTFEVMGREHAEVVGRIVIAIRDKGLAFAASASFVSALSRIVHVPEFDPDRFISKVDVHSHIMGKRRTKEEYAQMIEEVYSRQSRDRVPLCFLADELARERSVAKRQ